MMQNIKRANMPAETLKPAQQQRRLETSPCPRSTPPDSFSFSPCVLSFILLPPPPPSHRQRALWKRSCDGGFRQIVLSKDNDEDRSSSTSYWSSNRRHRWLSRWALMPRRQQSPVSHTVPHAVPCVIFRLAPHRFSLTYPRGQGLCAAAYPSRVLPCP